MEFGCFLLLPLELRRFIWRIALNDSSMTVMPVRTSSHTVPHPIVSSCRALGHSGIASVALSCSEAFSEWKFATSLLTHACNKRALFSRTIFVFHSSLQPSQAMKGLPLLPGVGLRIRHVAFFYSKASDAIERILALRKLPSLETIVVIFPSYSSQGQVDATSIIESLPRLLDKEL